jgi:hypothetical protein
MSKVPTGALLHSKELKCILRYRRDTRLYVAPGWQLEPPSWTDLGQHELILLKLGEATFFKERTLHQVHALLLPNKEDLYFDGLITRNFPFRIIEAWTNHRWYWHLKDGRPRFIFTNYFHAYGYMLRSTHGHHALYS